MTVSEMWYKSHLLHIIYVAQWIKCASGEFVIVPVLDIITDNDYRNKSVIDNEILQWAHKFISSLL